MKRVVLTVLALALPSWVAAQAPSSSTGPRTFVAIGCLARQGTAASPRYVITDRRGEKPTVYRLQGDAALLAPHVGHTIEVKGPLVGASASGAATLRVSSVVWIASTCKS